MSHRLSGYAADTCKPGFVWREASTSGYQPANILAHFGSKEMYQPSGMDVEDHVCVTPDEKKRITQQNMFKWRETAVRVDGVYTHACVEGTVWRRAFSGDELCVSQEEFEAVQEQNALADGRRRSSAP